ncbi:MAG: sulfite exporter TauE/SafE family protein [Acidobacteria bacterium]|nr:sulfite exporter TauE/SafE family protein [Acidobacteriota bacterium]
MLGLGGGMVYVPVLKWAGFNLKAVAIPLGLLLNGLNTLLALIPYSRARLVDWRGGLPMGLAATIFAPLGAYTVKYVPTRILLISFAIAVVIAALRMVATAAQQEPQVMMSLSRRRLLGAVSSGAIGFLGGLLGIGGGFLIAPLLMWMGYPTKRAAATTAYIVTFLSFSGFFSHVAEGHLNWGVTALAVLGVLLGSQLGATFMAKKAKAQWVKLTYAVVLLAIAAKLVLDALKAS